MKLENIKKWNKIVSLAIKTKQRQITLNNNTFEFRVFRFEHLKKGYMTIWNVDSKNAFHISRMEIGESIVAEIITIKESDIKASKSYGVPNDLKFNNSKPY